MIPQSSREQSFQLVKVGTAPLLIEQRKRLLPALQITASDLYYFYDAVEWQGTSLLEKLVELGQSCVVIGDKGAGKGSAAAWVEQTLATICVPQDLLELYLQLWQAMGQPVDGITGVCNCCPRRQVCQHDADDKRRYKPVFYFSQWEKPDADDIREYVNLDPDCIFPKAHVAKALSIPGIEDVIKKGEAEAKAAKIKVSNGDKYGYPLPAKVVIRLPQLSTSGEISELRELLSAILKSDRCLIILVDKGEQEKWLKGPLSRLHRVPFPRPDNRMLGEILQSRMETAQVDTLPFSSAALGTVAQLAGHLPGKFLEILNTSLLVEEGLVEPQDILRLFSGTMDEAAMVSFALGRHEERWVKVTDLADTIFELFRQEISERRLGRLLRQLGLKHRRNNGSEYLRENITQGK